MSKGSSTAWLLGWIPRGGPQGACAEDRTRALVCNLASREPERSCKRLESLGRSLMRLAFKRSPCLTESPGGVTKLCSAGSLPPRPGCLKRHAEKAEMPPGCVPRAFPCFCLEK